jgi:hypothetical protein
MLPKCEHAQMRAGVRCDAYAAPTLWCSACRPRLAAERGIDVARWPDWRYARNNSGAVNEARDQAAELRAAIIEHRQRHPKLTSRADERLWWRAGL